MKKFGIVGEGITDQITIENILCGFFDSIDDDDIAYLPNNAKGGWTAIFNYLMSSDFRNDVLSNEFIIVQIDTDISTKQTEASAFGIYYKDANGNELSTNELINAVIAIIVNKINNGQSDFYQENYQKIIFAISVHSIECWLIAHYAQQTEKYNCFDILKTMKFAKNTQLSKKRTNYDIISQPFLDKNTIQTVAQKDPSFNHFIGQLKTITLN
jgi:hypothetical protein